MSGLGFRVLGARGSAPVAGPAFARYGGNTTCFHVEVEPGHHLVIDCGTGLRTLQRDLVGRESQRFTMLLTHYHWDHIQGLPTFMPLFDASNTFVFRGPHHDVTVRQALTEAMRPPWWPVDFDEVAASVRFEDTTGSSRVGPVEVVAVQGSHPQGVVAYRLSGEEHAIVVATDHEGGDPGVDASIVGMARRAHVLIHDAQYTPEELRSSRKGWGHSSYESAVRTAVDAEVGRLVLTSHDPDRTDDQVDRMRGMARASFPHTDAAFEGMTLIL